MQPRGATSLDNSTWVIGDQNGLYTNNATTATPVGNFRAVKAFGGTAYTLQQSSTASAVVVSTVSLAGSGTITALPGLTNDNNAVDFTLVSSGANGSAFDVLYITDDTSASAGSIKKFALIGGTWTAEGTAAVTGMFGIAAAKDPVTGFDLYVTTGNGSSGSNNVDKFVDSAAWNAFRSRWACRPCSSRRRRGNEPQGNRLRADGRGLDHHRLVVHRRHGRLRHGRQLHRHDHERRQPRHFGQRTVLGRAALRSAFPSQSTAAGKRSAAGDQQPASDRQSARHHGELPRLGRLLRNKQRDAGGRPGP